MKFLQMSVMIIVGSSDDSFLLGNSFDIVELSIGKFSDSDELLKFAVDVTPNAFGVAAFGRRGTS